MEHALTAPVDGVVEQPEAWSSPYMDEVNAETGKVEEYQLTLTVRMSVVDGEDNEIISGQSIQVARDYPFDEQSVLGSIAEQRVLEREMIRQAAAQIVRRLDSVVRD